MITLAKDIPTHHLAGIQSFICAESVDHINHYDYKKLHRHSYYELFLFEKGGGTQRIDFTEYIIEKRTVFLVCPGQLHLVRRQAEANGLVLQFTGDYLAHLPVAPADLERLNHVPVGYKEFEEYFHLARKIEEHSAKPTAVNRNLAGLYLAILLGELIQRNDPDNASNQDAFFYARFANLIEDHFRESRTVTQYVKMMGVSFKKLNEFVKYKTGQTALQFIHQRLLLEIKRMLMHNELSQKEIAFELNFDSTASFNQFVKKQTGYTPGELKQQLLFSSKVPGQ